MWNNSREGDRSLACNTDILGTVTQLLANGSIPFTIKGAYVIESAILKCQRKEEFLAEDRATLENLT